MNFGKYILINCLLLLSVFPMVYAMQKEEQPALSTTEQIETQWQKFKPAFLDNAVGIYSECKKYTGFSLLHESISGYCYGELFGGVFTLLASGGKNGKYSLGVGVAGTFIFNFLLNKEHKKLMGKKVKEKKLVGKESSLNQQSLSEKKVNNGLYIGPPNKFTKNLQTNNGTMIVLGKIFYRPIFFWIGVGSSIVNQIRKLK